MNTSYSNCFWVFFCKIHNDDIFKSQICNTSMRDVALHVTILNSQYHAINTVQWFLLATFAGGIIIYLVIGTLYHSFNTKFPFQGWLCFICLKKIINCKVFRPANIIIKLIINFQSNYRKKRFSKIFDSLFLIKV